MMEDGNGGSCLCQPVYFCHWRCCFRFGERGITAASLGRLLKARGLRVTMQKFDPYLNMDPGTMNPFQHGEVFVTDDGAETDLDLGHYERFIDENLSQNSNVTSGRVYWNVIQKERNGDYGVVRFRSFRTSPMKLKADCGRQRKC